MKNILILTLMMLVVSVSAFADKLRVDTNPKLDSIYGSDLPLQSGHMIRILSYDSKTRTYTVEASEFPGEGESFVSPEGLARAIKTIDLQALLKKPKTLVGEERKLDDSLPTLFEEERNARAARK